MAVCEFNARISTAEFLRSGLGASLTQSAAKLIAAVFDPELDESERMSVALFAAKTIMERAAWRKLDGVFRGRGNRFGR